MCNLSQCQQQNVLAEVYAKVNTFCHNINSFTALQEEARLL